MSDDLPLHSADWPRLKEVGHAYDPAVAKPAFLVVLEREGNIQDACRACAVDRATVRTWRKKDPDFNRAVVNARRCWSEERGNLLEKHALDVALNGGKNQYVHDGEVHTLRRHDGKILQAALQQFSGWGQAEQAAAFVKEYILVGKEGETYSLSEMLKTYFAPQLREARVLDHDDDDH